MHAKAQESSPAATRPPTETRPRGEPAREPVVPATGTLTPIGLLGLQRAAGNAGVAALVTGQRTREPVVQRELTEEQRKEWATHGGPGLIASLRRTAEEWRAFRAQPTSFSDRPNPGRAPGQLAELLRLAPDTSYRRYVAEQLGGESIKFLSEMSGFEEGIRALVGVVPGIAYVPAGHKYTLRQKAAAEATLNGIPFVPVAEYEVAYSNAYGWHWTRSLLGGQMQWKAGVSIEREGGKWQVKPPSLRPTPARISINSTAAASPVGYWGYRDLAGVVKVVNGPSISATVVEGAAAGHASGGLISLEGGFESPGPPGSLDFMNLKTDYDVKVSLSSSPAKKETGKIKIKFSFNLVDAGGGLMLGGVTEVATPELVPTPVPAERAWHYIVTGFETGSAEVEIPPNEVHPVLAMMRSDIDEHRLSLDSIRPYLEEAGVQEEFALDVYCEGYASRRWTGAATDEERQANNLRLSTDRAANVTALIRQEFGDTHTYGFAGLGAAFWGFGRERPLYDPQGNEFGYVPEDTRGEVAPERSPEEVEAMVRRYVDQLRARGEPDDQITMMAAAYRESLMSMNKPTSDIPQARRVDITVRWRGHTISWGQNATPIPIPVP